MNILEPNKVGEYLNYIFNKNILTKFEGQNN